MGEKWGVGCGLERHSGPLAGPVNLSAHFSNLYITAGIYCHF